jgi:hypothetical protein
MTLLFCTLLLLCSVGVCMTRRTPYVIHIGTSIILLVTVSTATIVQSNPWVQCSMTGLMVQHCCCHQAHIPIPEGRWQQPCCHRMERADVMAYQNLNHSKIKSNLSTTLTMSLHTIQPTYHFLQRSNSHQIARAPPDRIFALSLSQIQRYLL